MFFTLWLALFAVAASAQVPGMAPPAVAQTGQPGERDAGSGAPDRGDGQILTDRQTDRQG